MAPSWCVVYDSCEYLAVDEVISPDARRVKSTIPEEVVVDKFRVTTS